MAPIFLLGLVLLGVALYVLLDRHEARRAAGGKSRHSSLRLILASFGLLLLLFSGGCSLLFGLNADGTYVTWQAVTVIGGPPIVAGFLIWFLATRRPSRGSSDPGP